MEEINKELTLMVRIDSYRPSRPAPMVQNHDHPGFSDSGDDEECEFTLFMRDKEGVLVELEDAEIYNLVSEDVFELAREMFK